MDELSLAVVKQALEIVLSISYPIPQLFAGITFFIFLMNAFHYFGRKGHLAIRLFFYSLFFIAWTLTAGGICFITIPMLGLPQLTQIVWFGLLLSGYGIAFTYIANIKIGD